MRLYVITFEVPCSVCCFYQPTRQILILKEVRLVGIFKFPNESDRGHCKMFPKSTNRWHEYRIFPDFSSFSVDHADKMVALQPGADPGGGGVGGARPPFIDSIYFYI